MAKNTLSLKTYEAAIFSNNIVPIAVKIANLPFPDVAKTNRQYDAMIELANRCLMKENSLVIAPEIAAEAIQLAKNVLEAEIAEADRIYAQIGEQQYHEIEDQAMKKFLAIFEYNASSAGYDVTAFKNYNAVGKKLLILSWIFNSSQTIHDFNVINSKIKQDIELFYEALEADTPGSFITLNDSLTVTASELLRGYHSPNKNRFFYFYGRFIGLQMDEYYKLYELEGDVIEALLEIDKGTDTIRFNRNTQSIQIALDHALTNANNTKKTAALNELKTIKALDLKALGNILDRYQAYFAIDYYTFSNYDQPFKNKVLQRIWDQYPLETAENVHQAFESALQAEKQTTFANLLNTINATAKNDFESMRSALEENADILNLNMDNYYNILNIENRQHVAKAILANKQTGFSNIAALNDSFTNAVETEKVFVLANAPVLEFGTTSVIAPFGDTTVLKTALNANQLYAFSSSPFSTEDNVNPTLTVYRQNGTALEQIGYYDFETTISFEVLKDGIYYLGIQCEDEFNCGSHAVKMEKAEKLDGHLFDLGLSGWEWYWLEDVTMQISDSTIVKAVQAYGGVGFVGLKPGSTDITFTKSPWSDSPEEATVTVTVGEDGQITFGEIKKLENTVIENYSA